MHLAQRGRVVRRPLFPHDGNIPSGSVSRQEIDPCPSHTNRRLTMKTMTGIAFDLATLMASPAFAQSNQGTWWDAYHSFAQETPNRALRAPVRPERRILPRRSWDAYDTNGRY